ncbi:uncharacterized protein F4822DRAFT_246637 [Hypoxylon trugodes]|uniref:uncharacterized protein n=1 Tax=Hypoxylon trugodes TaxID=326681 RepID=UPI00219F2D0B|nr:uncharacterized protein F4822DRAFT_246637 [Hypoxylon trugodes]KAI1388443.1 hypothetical protein F4822DRAFT_246637 [Hypoxylon trugodes]
MVSPHSITPLSTRPNEIGDDNDDDVSLNSTNGEEGDVDKDWIVEDIYAERDHPNDPGEMQYLIKWEGFPLDQCTWEPTVHLGPGVLESWLENQEEIRNGKRQPFDVEEFNVAYQERERRRKRRNAKRKRLGWPHNQPLPSKPAAQEPLPLTTQNIPSPTTEKLRSPIQAPPSLIQELPSLATCTRNEPVIDNDAPDTHKTKPSPPTSKAKPKENAQPKPTQVTATATVMAPAPVSAPAVKSKKGTNVTPNTKKKPLKRTSMPTSPPKPSKQSSESKRRASSGGTGGGTVTGYQGTARKPSANIDLGSSKDPPGKTSKAPTQKAPTSTSKTPSKPSTMPPKITSSLANKFSGQKLTATRTRAQPPPAATPSKQASNVLVAGKERKKRASLSDATDEPSKASKAFSTLRGRNNARKRSIEKSDLAHPDLSSIPASFLLTSDRNNRPSADQTKSNVQPAPPDPPIVQSPTAISPGDTSATVATPKVKKSVRFTRAGDIAPEDKPVGDGMDIDDVVDRPNDEPNNSVQPLIKSPPSTKKLSLAAYQEKGQAQLVSKMATFGKGGVSEPIRVLFGGITRQSQPWLSSFIAQEKLNFDSICASYDFIPHRTNLVEQVLSTGAIMSMSKEVVSTTLSNIAGHLRQGSYGCHLVTEQFSILVYPSGCSDWDGLEISLDKDFLESPLRHMIYRSPVDVRLYPSTTISRAPTSLSDKKPGTKRQMLIKDLIGLDFSHFLPQEPKTKDNQVFMLLFPDREMQLCNIIKLWLRSCQPNCRIFSHEIEDSWSKFHETVRGTGAAGTLILHEDVSVSIRKLPRISQMIENKRNYTFWNVATGQYNPPRFPSDEYDAIEPGNIRMTRLFPQGRAFLVTPSFVLSDPIRLCQFLEWFKAYCYNPHYLLVACAGFPEYLKTVTLEKAKEHEELRSLHKDNPKLDDILTESGLAKKDLEARFRVWEILEEIIEEFGNEETSEEIRKVFWITDLIDQNDEQSLVNWFCWWSALKCDQYRKFAVLGSSNSRHKAAYRNIEIPVYTKETVGDPDVALTREKQRRQEREAAIAADDMDKFSQAAASVPSHTSVGSTAITQSTDPVSKSQSIIFKNDRPEELRSHILKLSNRFSVNNWARLHANPVSWLDVSMADHFGDPLCRYDTFKNWLGAAPRFGGVNTWYGLFYTIDKGWIPQAPPHTYACHPWIAVVRPMNPHKAKVKYDNIELFIWDIAAHDREIAGGHAALLLGMQRHLVNLVRETLPSKDKQYYLGEVYISSKAGIETKPNEHPLDVTYRRLQEMLAHGKDWLPPFENLLPDAGWKSLPKSQWKSGMITGLVNVPSVEEEQAVSPPPIHHCDEELQRSIWHAPRPKQAVESTKCVNHLYEAVAKVRGQDPLKQKMRYQYRSTLDWYHDMKVEGRDAGHVNVDSADKIIPKLFNKK